jgi:tetratricopeptide (TPR) repeat protein
MFLTKLRRPIHTFWFVIACCLLLPLHASAEVQTIRATGEYRMGEYDSHLEAQRLALFTAKSLALDRAVTYLDTVSAVKQLGLNREELRAYSVGLFEIRHPPIQTPGVAHGTTVSIPVTIMIEPAVVTKQLDGLMRNERAKTELMKASDKIEAYRKELETEQQRLATSMDKDDVRLILQHRRDILSLIDTEEQLAHTWTSLAGVPRVRIPEGRAKQEPPTQKKEPPGTPDNAEEHRKKGALLVKQGNYDEAIAEFRLALRLMPDLDRAHLGLGAALQGKGDLDGAIAEYRTLLKRHPNDPDGHNDLGSALQRKGDLTAAISEYRTALQFRPDDALTHYNLATALSTKGHVEDAIGEYRTAIKLNPDLVETYFNLGSLLKEENRTREAVEMFREYVRRAPGTSANQPWIKEAQTFLDKVREERQGPGGRQGPGS